ncbi:aldo/keto reductase [Demequina sp. NBRC 110051]|uniref:aldo/keto reductase n=1 Tax=Demequina sp. NBRC 110051 TaxID=1570340 RepID=UPI000A042E94|nr:aldo/keto reductase [Demequina sp. NBRC 110051]
MDQRNLGQTVVSAIGLGAMPMSIEGRPDEARSFATIHAALDAGVTLIDIADAYLLNPGETGHNEQLITRAVAAYPGGTDAVLIATKAGSLRPGDGTWYQNGDPAYLKEAAKASALRLGVDSIGLLQFHRPDPKVPYADSVGAFAELLDEGVIRQAGISNANPDQIREAHDVLGGRLASVQNQFSPAFVSSYPELELCAEMGIAFLPWSPLGGIGKAGDVGTRFVLFQQVADARGVSAQQVVLAWELALADVVIPIPGASRPSSILDSAAAAELELSEDDMALLGSVLQD